MHVFGGMKKLVQLKFVQLLLLNKVTSQIFLDSIQKRAPARSVQLEAVYLEALHGNLDDFLNGRMLS